MKWVKRILGLLALCLVLSMAGAIAWVHYYLNSPRMSEKIRRIVSERFFTRLEFDKAEINLLSGMKVQGARLLSNEDPAREYASLEEAVLEYSPLSLLHNTIEINTIRLKSPLIEFHQRADGRWRMPRDEGSSGREMIFRTSIFRFNILLNQLLLEKGELRVMNSKKDVLFAAREIDVNGQLQFISGKNDAKGNLQLKTLDLGSYLQMTDIQASFEFADSVLKLPKLTGRVHGGTCEGVVQLNTGIGGSNFLVDINMRDIDLASLLKSIQSDTGKMEGRLQIQAHLTGDLNQTYPLQGSGQIQVGQAKLAGIAGLDKLGELLNLAQLRDIPFDSIRGTFKIEDQKIIFYELEARSKDLSLTGTGSIGFDRKLDFDVLLILSPELAAQIPVNSQAQFAKRENGSRTVTFRLNGSLDEPGSNLGEKLSVPVAPTDPNQQASRDLPDPQPVSSL